MTALQQAAQQALEALEQITDWDKIRAFPLAHDSITALRQALQQSVEAEQQVEPVAEVLDEGGAVEYISYVPEPGTLLYTSPQPAQQPLTDEQIVETLMPLPVQGTGYFLRIARAVERAHGIGGEK